MNYTLEQVHQALEQSWTKETCFEPQQKDWDESCKEQGQCSVSALIIQDYLGGELIKAKTNTNISHFWNIIGTQEIDLTKTQFDKDTYFLNKRIVKRTSDMENERYFLLKMRVKKYLQDNF